jgi:hypothetical protein
MLIMPFISSAEDKVPIKIKRVFTKDGRENEKVEAGLGDRIQVEIDKLSDAIKNDNLDLRKFVLFLDGHELNGIYARSVNPVTNALEFELERTDTSKKAWNSILGSPKISRKTVQASVGPENGNEILPSDITSPPTFRLIVFHRRWFVFSSILFLGILALFVWRAKAGSIVRDANPPNPPAGFKKPYSLARLQMAFWFFLVIGSLVYIYLITGDYNTITEQALILIGIGTGTALGAAAIDASKRSEADSQLNTLLPQESKLITTIKEAKLKQSSLSQKIQANPPGTPEDVKALSDLNIDLAEKEAQIVELQKKIEEARSGLSKPVSEGLIKDLLSDVNGTAFHRFQMVVWTLVLGFLFCVGVYKSLAMPDFSVTLLALMGISAGTYLGFKIPERQL